MLRRDAVLQRDAVLRRTALLREAPCFRETPCFRAIVHLYRKRTIYDREPKAPKAKGYLAISRIPSRAALSKPAPRAPPRALPSDDIQAGPQQALHRTPSDGSPARPIRPRRRARTPSRRHHRPRQAGTVREPLEEASDAVASSRASRDSNRNSKQITKDLS